jgi:hypothetical protein
LTTDERAELVRLRREARTLAMENEISKRAAASFAGRFARPVNRPSRSVRTHDQPRREPALCPIRDQRNSALADEVKFPVRLSIDETEETIRIS